MTHPPADWSNPRKPFMLASDQVYLNAGTYSALPRKVYEKLVELLATAEANPTRDAAMRGRSAFWRVQTMIARHFNAEPAGFLLHPNVTEALNQAIFTLPWERGGEFLVSDQEYGAIVNASRDAARRNGMIFRRFALPTQPGDAQQMIDAVLSAVTDNTAAVLISHVTCAGGLVTPLAPIGRALRDRGVRFIVDGAHAPGLVDVDLIASNADLYGGNLHKWFMGPKGTGFLYASPAIQSRMWPHVVGWGGVPTDETPLHDAPPECDSRFQHVFRMQGLRDFSPFLALEATLAFRQEMGEQAMRDRLAELNAYTRRKLGGELGLPCLSARPEFNAGLITFTPPEPWRDTKAFERMFEKHRITVPMWQDAALGWIIRVSPGIWSSFEDVDKLAAALR